MAMRIVFTRRNDALDAPDGINAGLFAVAHALIGAGHEVIAVGPTGSAAGVASTFGGSGARLPEIIAFAPDLANGYVNAMRAWAVTGARAAR